MEKNRRPAPLLRRGFLVPLGDVLKPFASRAGRVPVLLMLAAGVMALSCLRSHAADSEPPLPDAQRVIAFLNQTINWYHRQNPEEIIAAQQGAVVLVSDERQLADQILALSFDSARGAAQLLVQQAQQSGQAPLTGAAERYQELARRTEAKIGQEQAELNALKQKLAGATGRSREVLQAAVEREQSNLDLARAAGEAIKGLLQFAVSSAGSDGGGRDLLSQIDRLEQSVPQARAFSARSSDASQPASPAPSPAAARKTEASSILALISELLDLSRQRRGLDQALALTGSLAQSSLELAVPLRAGLRDAVRRGEQVGDQPQSVDPAELRKQKREIDELSAQFKRFSAASLPLSKQRMLLDIYKSRLERWRLGLEARRVAAWSSLLWRLAALGIILALTLGMSEIWRRATFRYIQEPRRRSQFLLLRRIVVLVVIALLVVFSLVSDLSSLTTFAGLLTAGIAIALQNVILSFVGYFVLIGKYGIRVGDRLQISRVTGQVAEIGLVRLYLMELGGTGSDAAPTGRIVEFPNSVVFDANAGVFKQLPGTSFAWHEVSVMLARDADYRSAEQSMLRAVDSVFADYSGVIERQHRDMERTMQVTMNAPRPQSRFRLSQAGIEIAIRYPVELEHAPEIDDRITRALLAIVEPRAKSGAGAPGSAARPASTV